MTDTESTLRQMKITLDRLSEEVSEAQFPVTLLQDLKLSVDQLRLALWATLTYEHERVRNGGKAGFDLKWKVSEFRLKRLLQMLSQLQADLQAGSFPPKHADLPPLSAALRSTLQSLDRLGAAAA